MMCSAIWHDMKTGFSCLGNILWMHAYHDSNVRCGIILVELINGMHGQQYSDMVLCLLQIETYYKLPILSTIRLPMAGDNAHA